MNSWHIITCEYPPQVGGVSDYTGLLAGELRKAGDAVEIWAPAFVSDKRPNVHRSLGNFSAKDLRQTDELLDQCARSRILLMQWVPHGYGKRGINLGFTRWIASRAKRGDQIYLMVHEPYLEYGQGSLKRHVVSLLQRLMIRKLLYASSRVFISIPAWENYLRPYAPPGMKLEWLSIPATINAEPDPGAVSKIRARLGNSLVVGHLGTYSAELRAILDPAVSKILREVSTASALLMGNRSDLFAADLKAARPDLADRIHGTGLLSDSDLANHIAACDLALQPYPDGLSSRRTSLMNLISRGIAVVSNLGHLTESLWAESNAVALCSTTEATQLASLCAQLLRDKQRRQELAQAARALYSSRFDWSNVITALRSSPEAAFSATASITSNQPERSRKLE